MAHVSVHELARRARHFEPTRHHTHIPSVVNRDPTPSAKDDSLSLWIGVAIIAGATLCGLALPWI